MSERTRPRTKYFWNATTTTTMGVAVSNVIATIAPF